MPNRLLREGICTSDAINLLTAEEEVLFYRLLVLSDDYGYMDARPAILKAHCFPLRDTVTPPLIEKWLCGLAGKGLIVRYRTADGKVQLAVNKWEQRVRSRPKYVGPEADGCQPIDGQLSDKVQADDGLGKGKGKGKGAALATLPDDWMPDERVAISVAKQFGFSLTEIPRYVEAFRDACQAKSYRYSNFDAAFRNSVRKDWGGIRQGRQPDGARKVAI